MVASRASATREPRASATKKKTMPEALEGRVVMVSLLWWLREPQPPENREPPPPKRKRCLRLSKAEWLWCLCYGGFESLSHQRTESLRHQKENDA